MALLSVVCRTTGVLCAFAICLVACDSDDATPTADANVADAASSTMDAGADSYVAPRDAPGVDAQPDVIEIPLPPECTPPKLALVRIGEANEPLAVVQPPGDNRIYVAERRGLIKVIKNGETQSLPFLDMRTSIAAFMGQGNGQGERGLINMVFHPDYIHNGRFFVFYTRSATDPIFDGVKHEGDIVVAEGHRSVMSPEEAEPRLQQILAVQHDGVNGREGCCDDAHNGGLLAFGPDGYLYTAIGDGGGGANEFGDKIPGLSNVFRFNVDEPSTPPAGALAIEGAHPFAWAKGVRNPWRGSFDPKTGDLYFGDVGEATWEEVNYVPAGQLASTGLDFRWGNPGMEGTRVVRYYPYLELGTEPYGVLPIFEYEHPIDPNSRRGVNRLARAVVGGVVYRGKTIANMNGRYFFGDYASNHVWSLLNIGGKGYCVVDHTSDLVTAETPISGLTGFAQAGDGEMMLFDIFGNIYRIEERR